MHRSLCIIILLVCYTVYVTSKTTCGSPDVIKLQLSFSKQARFAGYYAANEKNYYFDECLIVYISDQDTANVLSQVESSASITFGSYWTQRFLQEVGPDKDRDVVNIAQMLFKSGFMLASFATSDAVIKGKTIALWGGVDVEPRNYLKSTFGLEMNRDYTAIAQRTPGILFNGSADLVSAMTYDEYGAILQTINPVTGQLWQPADVKVYSPEDKNLGTLKDGVIVRRSWFYQNITGTRELNQDIALRFMKASMKGWLYCREQYQDCVKLLNLQDTDSATWQLNEVLDMMFNGIDKFGTMNLTLLNRTKAAVNAIYPDSGNVDNSKYFDFNFINKVYEAMDNDSRELNQTIDWIKPYNKIQLNWCLSRTGRAMLCFDVNETTTDGNASSSNTGTIVGVVVGVSATLIILAIIFAFTAFIIIVYFKRRPSRMKVPLFKDMRSANIKDSSTKAEFRSLLKNYDFVSILAKTSQSDDQYSKDIKRALVYFHVNNDTLVDMFDFFLVKELESNKAKKKKALAVSVQKSDSETESLSSISSMSDASSTPKQKSKKAKKPKLSSNNSLNDDYCTLFREDSLVTDIFRYYSQLVGLYYLWYILSYPVKKLEKFGKKQGKEKKKRHPGEQHLNMQVFGLSVEVDPKKVSLGDVTINKLQLQILAQQIFVSITRSVDSFPELLRDILKKLEDRVMEYEGDEEVLKVMGNFVFLRYICAALINPHEYGLLEESPGEEMQRIMILLSKVMQNLANGRRFEKEEYMMEMNDFITTNLEPMKKYLREILEGAERIVTEGMRVPSNVEEAGISVVYHFCAENRRKISKALAEMNAETGWLFDEIFPEDSDSDDSDVEKGT